MDETRNSNFAIGFLIGLLLCVILWYWQKSTAAEDGALDLLEQYAATERQRHLGEQARQTAVPLSPNAIPAPSVSEPPFDFTSIKGIGPIFNQRLHQADITTLASFLALSSDALTDLLDIGSNRAQAILADAHAYYHA